MLRAVNDAARISSTADALSAVTAPVERELAAVKKNPASRR